MIYQNMEVEVACMHGSGWYYILGTIYCGYTDIVLLHGAHDPTLSEYTLSVAMCVYVV